MDLCQFLQVTGAVTLKSEVSDHGHCRDSFRRKWKRWQTSVMAQAADRRSLKRGLLASGDIKGSNFDTSILQFWFIKLAPSV